MVTKEDVKEGIIQYFEENPNTSPVIILDLSNQISYEFMGIVAAQICIMRESDKSLIVTGQDESGGILLSLSQKLIDDRKAIKQQD